MESRQDAPPLSLDLVSLTPITLLPPLPKPSGSRVPDTAEPYPSLPAGFQLSPTSNYAAPYGQGSLGETLRCGVRLLNTSRAGVAGVKMMMEVQSPGGRVRLGEVVHGGARPEGMDPSEAEARAWDELPVLDAGDGVDLEGKHEFTELGHHILICSVAWETAEGRRTFQRFLKFNVAAPLAIKTRVLTPGTPNTTLDPQRREDVYLEVLMQNVSPVSMLLEEAELDPVSGLVARNGSASDASGIEADLNTSVSAGVLNDLLPGDTVQRLFVLSPAPDPDPDPSSASDLPLSAFPPNYAAGTVLPLGRLKVSWLGGPHREPGQFVTSMLNRRTTAARPTSVISLSSQRLSLRKPPSMEYDLTVTGSREAEVENELPLKLRIVVRTPPVAEGSSPPPPHELGVQVLTPTPAPTVADPRPTRPNSIGTPPGTPRTPGTPIGHRPVPSRPPSQAPAPALFPPPPTTRAAPGMSDGGRLLALGNSLVTAKLAEWTLVRERAGTSYAAEAPGTGVGQPRWETSWEGEVRWMALAPGVADLGGIRALAMGEGAVGKEWDLGSAVVFDQ